MGFVTAVLIVGTLVRLALLFLRPSARDRFHHPRRRLLATRAEQAGDLLTLATAVALVAFGYGRHPSGAVEVLWCAALLAGFGLVTFAHDIARRHRPHGSGSGGPPRPSATPRAAGPR